MSQTDNLLTEEELREVYEWVDSFNLSKPKRNIGRDFSDGILLAEILREYYPNLVQIHSYSSVNAKKDKLTNWEFLNSKLKRQSIP